MISALATALLIPLIIVYFIINAYKRPHSFPPGPPSLPIYGAFHFLRAYGVRNSAKACIRLGKKYKTKVLGFYLGAFPCVILNDPGLIKEMLCREDFDGRLDIVIARLRSYWKRLGVFFTDGYFWYIQRRFSLRHMRDFGFGRRDGTLEEVISHEIMEMIDMRVNGPKYPAEKEIVKGDLVDIHKYFLAPVMNGLCHVLSQTTLPRSEYHVLWDVARHNLMFIKNTDDLGGALAITPWLKNIAPNWSGYNTLCRGSQRMLDFITKIVDEALATHDDNYNRHFLDVYISKMKEEQRRNGKTTFSEDQLRLLCSDYMLPSSSGTQVMLTILVEHLLLQPEVQDKIHEEIDHVVGRDRLPTLDDRRNMPYTEACIRETLRCDTLVPMGVPHRAVKDTTIAGYNIAEDTVIAANFATLHMSKEIWGDPENFRPERFIENGQLDVSKDKSLPFGAGRRLCPGETFSRQTMFQVFSAFMQAFHVSTADGRPLLKPVPRLPGLIISLPELWVRLTPR